jgi:Flp pilus assembly protein protease CpaA
VDIVLGFAVTIFVLALLLYAAIKDIQTGEVSNCVWILGLLAFPVTIFRMVVYGAILLYVFQATFVCVFVVIGFYVGLMGGADGKAILFVSLMYPWTVFTPLWLIAAPFVILVGGFCLLGVHSLILSIRNGILWRRSTPCQRETVRPAKRMFWFTRRFKQLHTMKNEVGWEPVTVALIAYFFVAFIGLLVLLNVQVLVLN